MEKALNVLKDLCLVINFNSYWKPRVDEAITEIEEAQLTRREWYQKGYNEAMKPKTCQECKWWDRTRPRSHPNYAECNNRNCPISYEEVIYTFGCNMYEPEDNA